jgi:hypothetical protein
LASLFTIFTFTTPPKKVTEGQKEWAIFPAQFAPFLYKVRGR